MIEMLDDLAASPHLPVVAVAVAVLGLVLALLLAAQVARLARRLRGVEDRREDVPASGRAGAPATGSQPVESDPSAAPEALDERIGEVAPTTAENPGVPEPVTPLAEVAAMREAGMLGRQLELLDELERREEDPEALGMLFQLDNLTMRLRRNAESVMVLARGSTGRRAREALALSDAARTACAQIEGYDRVSVEAASDPVVQASAVVPLAHLLAELLENATRFSEPDSQVVVRVDEDERGAVVTVADAGIGMDAATLEEARGRLSSSAIPPGGRIGLVVVGRLAQRLGIQVDLEPGTPGTTAVVRVPARLLATGSDRDGAGAGLSAAPAASVLDEASTAFGGHGQPATSAHADPGPLPRRSRSREAATGSEGTTEAPRPAEHPAWPSSSTSAVPVEDEPSPMPGAATTAPPLWAGSEPAALPVRSEADPSGSPVRDDAGPPDVPGRAGAGGRFGDPVPSWPPLAAGTPTHGGTTPAFAPAVPAHADASGAPFTPGGTPDAPVPASSPLSSPQPVIDAPAPAPAPLPSTSFTSEAFLPEASAPSTEVLPRVPGGADGFAPETASPTAGDEWFVPGRPAAGSAAEPALRDEVLAELGRFSSYRPSPPPAAGSSTLERRTPVAVAEPVTANRGPVDRDASSVRSKFSAFRSGTGRGRGGRR